MLKNYLAAAIRNLFRDRAYAAINIFGLALGFAAVILIGLFVRDELSHDRAHPDSDRIFRTLMQPNQGPPVALSNASFARALELDFPEVQSATRLVTPYEGPLKAGNVEIPAFIGWADPEFFGMFPPKVVAGGPVDNLAPDTLVVTRRIARRLFGREDIVGELVEVERRQTLRIAAVIENLPSNTHFKYDAIARLAREPGNVHTYARLRPDADVRKLNAQMKDFLKRHDTQMLGTEPAWKTYDLTLVALPDIHFLPSSMEEMKPPSDRRTVDAFIVIGLLILFVAGSNFVSMMTARAARRAIEVGVRKAVGATRRQIVVQFLSECLFYTALALGVAMLAAELALPGFNGFLQRAIAFDYVREPALGAAIVAAWLLVSVAAGAYPAFVLSLFRPVTVLKGALSLPGGPGRLRNALVVLQFAVMVALIVSTITIHRQTRFAIEDQLRVPGDQMYLMSLGCALGFRDSALRIPGVRGATCASDRALTTGFLSNFTTRDGGSVNLRQAMVDTGFFEMFGIEPLAGRLFDEQHGEDHVARDGTTTANPSFILNESASRALGYANPADAVGKTHYWSRPTYRRDARGRVLEFLVLEPYPSQVVGVVPDFVVGSIRNEIDPTAFLIDPNMTFVLLLKLDGQAIPETMRALEAAWKSWNNAASLPGRFMSQIIEDRYADIRRQTKLFAAFSVVAIVVASLGLLGLAVFTAERRTREIGLRKVMGATRQDILRFIGWQFARPVVLANLLAWPVAWFFMRRWLDGFAYHVDLGPMTFVGASAIAALIALTTVSGHALLVARARPAEALRYE